MHGNKCKTVDNFSKKQIALRHTSECYFTFRHCEPPPAGGAKQSRLPRGGLRATARNDDEKKLLQVFCNRIALIL